MMTLSLLALQLAAGSASQREGLRREQGEGEVEGAALEAEAFRVTTETTVALQRGTRQGAEAAQEARVADRERRRCDVAPCTLHPAPHTAAARALHAPGTFTCTPRAPPRFDSEPRARRR